MKVWLIGSDDTRFRLPLLFELRKRGFEVGAVGSEDPEVFAKAGIPYWRYSLERWVNPWADVRTRRQLRDLFREQKPDVIHAFDTKPALIAPVAASEAGVPGRVRTITGMGYVFSSLSPLALSLRPVYRRMQRRASRATHLTIFQNPEDREYFLSHRMVSQGREALIRSSGIDIEKIEAARPGEEALAALRRELQLEGKLVVTMITRLVVHKGVREYLRAAARVRAQRKDVVFLLVGPSSSEGRQAVSVAEVQASAADVRYLGPRGDVPALLSVSDLFVLPSYYREGVPRVLLEAGALGLPLITSDMPGCREVVREGWNGSLVPPRRVEELAAAVLRLLQSPAERAAMGARSRAHVSESFSLALVSRAYADVYERVLRQAALDAAGPARF